MIVAICAAGLFFLLAIALHIGSALVVAVRFRQGGRGEWPLPDMPPVTLLRPVCGLENYIDETMRSSFHLDYPNYEILFCAADRSDPVVPLVRRLIREYPHIPARILIGGEVVNGNPKLDNVAKGWRAASHDWIVMADANVLMPCDYVQRLLAKWRPGTGLVCSPPVGFSPSGFAAELECAFLNTYQARWQYSADSLGWGFAQGKTMLLTRSDFERAGGLRALGAEVAEDAAATKMLGKAGLRIRLVDIPFEQPVGKRTLKEVWRRQVRWAQMRRSTFPLFYAPEILTNGLFPLAAGVFTAGALGLPLGSSAVVLFTVWYGAEAFLAQAAEWHLGWRSPVLWMLRDLMIPAIWINGWFGNQFVWRGNRMRVMTGAQKAAGHRLASVDEPAGLRFNMTRLLGRLAGKPSAQLDAASSRHAHH
jgi:ceramide glucosyltransferase